MNNILIKRKRAQALSVNLKDQAAEKHSCPRPTPTTVLCPQYQLLKCSLSQLEEQRPLAIPKAILAARSPAPNSNKTPCQTRGHAGHQKYRPQRPDLIKTNSEISTQTYINPKPRCLDTSLRTQSTTVRKIWHHQSPVTLLQHHPNIPIQLSHKITALKTTL